MTPPYLLWEGVEGLLLLLATALGRCGSLGLLGRSLLLGLVGVRVLARVLKHVRKTALAAVMTVEMHGHVHASTALVIRALLPQASDLARSGLNTIVLEDRKLNLLVLALDLAGLGVGLLLTLLARSKESKREVQGALLREILEELRVLQLVAGNNEALLDGRNACEGYSVRTLLGILRRNLKTKTIAGIFL
jgi:hypothetical protein